MASSSTASIQQTCPLPVLSHTASAILYLPSMPYLFPINSFTLPSHPLYILPLPYLCSLAVLFLTYMYVPPLPPHLYHQYTCSYPYFIIMHTFTALFPLFPPTLPPSPPTLFTHMHTPTHTCTRTIFSPPHTPSHTPPSPTLSLMYLSSRDCSYGR